MLIIKSRRCTRRRIDCFSFFLEEEAECVNSHWYFYANPIPPQYQVWIQGLASYLKSIDNKHLLAIGMEGFYGDSTPDEVQYNPSSLKYGTDFIRNNLIKEIDYTTIHAYIC